MRPQRVHYLRGNAAERSPRRLLVLDTETRRQELEGRELLTLRLWAANWVWRVPGQVEPARLESAWGRERSSVADQVEAWARSDATLWLFAHNLSFDLVTSDLPLELTRRGWELRSHNLASEAPWALLRRRSKSIRLADSFSYLPTSVEVLGQALGLSKPELPEAEESEQAWLERCRADCEITTQALLRLMAEWDRRKLGYWSLTGPATAWNSMLHMAPQRHRDGPAASNPEGAHNSGRLLTAHPVIEPNPAARAFERQAIYAGRREVWRTGRIEAGPWCYLDFRAAHLSVCAWHQLPTKRTTRFESLALDDWRLSLNVRSLIAECVVETAEPRYPLRHRGLVLHPVGRFRTVLAGPELKEARDRGELVSIGAGWTYRVGTHMQPWARWALPLVTDEEADCDPLLRIFLKGASRSVPGRWAMLVNRELGSGPSAIQGWQLEKSTFGDPPRKGLILRFGGRYLELVRDQEAEDSFPAVLSHIQSWVRVYLNRALDRLGPGGCLQVNTDSMLVPERRVWELAQERAQAELLSDESALVEGCRELSASSAPLEARVKAIAERVEVLSPQHLRLDGRRMYAGVPASRETVELAPNVFQFWTWPKLLSQMERGDPRGYVRVQRRVDLSGMAVSRWQFCDGCCEPVEASWWPEDGGVRLLPWRGGVCRHGAALRPFQHPVLRGLL